MNKPTFNRVMIEILDEEQNTGLLVQRESQVFAVAKIVALGQVAGYRNEIKLQDFSVGQTVIVQKAGILPVATVNESFKLIADDAIVSIIEE